MTNYGAKTVDDYILQAPAYARQHLRQLRELVKQAVPEVQEGISWGKPYYRYKGMLAGFDAYKQHIGIEIWADRLDQADRQKLEDKGYKTTQRTFQIRYDQAIPTSLLDKMLKAQAALNEAKDKA